MTSRPDLMRQDRSALVRRHQLTDHRRSIGEAPVKGNGELSLEWWNAHPVPLPRDRLQAVGGPAAKLVRCQFDGGHRPG